MINNLPSDLLMTKNFLVVDDEPELLELISSILRSIGLKCKTAGSGNQALELIENHPIDIVLSDVKMPNGSGIDLIKALKKRDSEKPLLAFLSAYSEMDEAELLDLGAKFFLRKPIDYNELIENLEKIIDPA